MRVFIAAAVFSIAAWGQNAAWDGIRKIYIAPLGDDFGASVIHARIGREIVKTGRFEVVETAEEADAVLSGEGHITKTMEKGQGGRKKAHEAAAASLQLVGKDQAVLWKDEESAQSSTNRASLEIGREVARKLAKMAAGPK